MLKFSIKELFLLAVFVIVSNSLFSANRYWVGLVSGNWNSITNWSAVSGGTPGASVPGAADVAIFDGALILGVPANGDCNLNAAANVLGFQINGYAGTVNQLGLSVTVGATGYSQTSGIFTGNSAAISINGGNFVLNGGTFTCTSGNFNIGGTSTSATIFTHFSGQFYHNNGTVTFNRGTGGCSLGAYNVDVLNSTSFYNITVNLPISCGNNHSLTTAAGDTLEVTNNFNHTDGYINGIVEVKNNLTLNANADGGSGWIIFDGSGAQTYSVAAGFPRTCWIKINKTAGAVSPAGGTTTLSCQGYYQQQGDFTAPTGNFNIGGTEPSATIFTHVAGLFTHNNGTVIFDATTSICSGGTYTVDVINSTSFYNVIESLPTVCGYNFNLTTVTGDTLDVTNNFTHTDGYFNGMVEVKNNLILNANADGGTGWIIFNGAGAQTYSVVAGSPRTCWIKINKTAGAVSPAGGTTALSCQGYYQQLGDFTAPTGNFNIGGTEATANIFTHAAGVFTHNNGTVIFDATTGNCSGGIYTIDIINTTSFYNVTESLPTVCGYNFNLTTATGDTLDVTNNFTHTDGYFNGMVEVKNNLILNANADGGTGWIIFNGAGTQTYSVVAGSPRTCWIKINKTTGAVSPAGGTTTLSCQGYYQQLGDFTAPTGNFNIGGTGTSATIFTHVAGIFTHNNGTVIFDATTGNCSSGIYTVDVNNSTAFYNVTENLPTVCGYNFTLTSALGDTLDVINDFTHSDGYFNGIIEVKNNLTLGAIADGGTGWIIFDGVGIQTYSVAAGFPRTCWIKINKISGSVSPAGGTTALSCQGYYQQQGDFTAPTGNFNVGGTEPSATIFTHVAGAFVHNNGTVIFDATTGNCSSGTYTVDVINATSFYNVTENLPTVCGYNFNLTTAVGDTIDAINDFTHTDGYFNGKIEVKNNLTLNANADGGTGWIIFDGSGAQTYSVVSGSPRTCWIKINKTVGAVSPAGGTTALSCQGYYQQIGDFTAPTGSFNIGGTETSAIIFTHVAGTFFHNSGTVIFDATTGNCSSGTYTVDVNNSTIFYNVTENLPTVCGYNFNLTTAVGDTIDAINDFTHTDGYFNGKIEVKNNLILNTNADGGTGWIIFDGTGAQTYSVAAGSSRTCWIKVNKISGTISPAGGTTRLSCQGYYQQLGDFIAPTGNFSIGGTEPSATIFTHAVGTFSHNNGTIIFDANTGGCSAGIYSIDVINSTSFYNFTQNLTTVCGYIYSLNVSAGDTIDVDNNLVLTDGKMVNNFIECQGNVTINASYDATNSTRLILNGANNTTVDATGATALFDAKLVIAKQQASNTVTLFSQFQLDAAAQTVTFTKGRIVSSSTNYLNIGDNVTVNSVSDSSYVDGPVRKTGNDAFTFPVGKTSANGKYYYRQASITAPSVVTDHFTCEYFLSDPNALYDVTIKDATLDHISRCEYWMLNRTGGTSNVKVTLSWRDSTSCGVTILADLSIGRWDSGTSTWKDHGNGGTTGSINSGTITTTANVTSFSPFALASKTSNNPLPIELVSFTATPNGSKVDINWRTATEINNDYFTIEKSSDGLTFDTLAIVDGAGNSTSILNYSFPDNVPYQGVSYYRLKQTDFNGEYKYSNIVSVEFGSHSNLNFDIYPNPSSGDNVSLSIENSKGSEVLVVLRDAAGKEIYSKIIITEIDGKNIIAMDCCSKLSVGTYFITASSKQEIVSKKMIIK